MPKKPTLDEEDLIAFRDAVRGVKPLISTKMNFAPRRVSPKKPAKKSYESPSDEADTMHFSDYDNSISVGSEDKLEFARNGISHKMLRKLRLGQYNIDAILDLHGKTIEEAREILSTFLLHCQQNVWRHVLIIHGKGRHNTLPILKNKLNSWLRQTTQVLAFCSATPKDGHRGALYVLLRR